MELDFKKWAESIFGKAVLDDPIPASEIPRHLNNGADPRYEVPDTDSDPLLANLRKKQKKCKDRYSSSSSSSS
jgi:hypothetical protein